MTKSRPALSAWENDRTIVRFPDPAVEVVDERFRSLVVWQEVVERLWTGGRWLEGPVWFGDGRYLLFSDIPNNRMLCWNEITRDVTVFRQPSNKQWQHQGPPRATRDLRAPDPTRHSDGTRRHHHGPDEQLRGKALKRPQRRHRSLRRVGVVHRPWLGNRRQLRG